jgi:hypothetical protein
VNDTTKEACRRAQLILEAHSNITGNGVHLFDLPRAVIAALLTDFLHYCDAKSEGESPDSPSYLDLESIVTAAREQFLKETKSDSVRVQ